MSANGNEHEDRALREQADGVASRCLEHACSVATAESCTGGWIAKCLTDVAGSSGWFLGGVVAYSNALKKNLLGVAPELLETEGAVSEAVAQAMVHGVLAATGADEAVAVTGIAGPGGGSAEKPVGTVWIGRGRRGGQPHAVHYRFEGDREAVRRGAVAEALAALCRER